LLAETDLAEQASDAAARAASRAGVSIRELTDVRDLADASRLVAVVWSDDGPAKAPAEFLRALAYAGNYVAGAFVDGRLAAMSVAFFGRDRGPLTLHSHITGVHPDWQGRAVGFALKQHQRAWALARGIEVIEWTTDPLVRRNGFFNLQKLGAEMTEYHVDFYGRMADGINVGEESDRVVVQWSLTDPRALAAAEGSSADPRDASEAATILGEDGAVLNADGASSVRAWVPADVIGLRGRDVAEAHRWRVALRESFGRAIDAGFRARSMTRDGWYLLSR